MQTGFAAAVFDRLASIGTNWTGLLNLAYSFYVVLTP